MNPRELRQRVRLERKRVTGRDKDGGEIVAWDEIATRAAAVEPLSGRERFAAQQVQAEVTHRVRLRHPSGVTPEMRVVLVDHGQADRNFNILAALNPEERSRELELLCAEKV